MLVNKDIYSQYINGNTNVTIYSDCTKVREYDDINNVIISHPESIDIKITNYCDMGCSYCHEQSTKEGKESDIFKLLDVLSVLPSGVELAIGGGNPLSHYELYHFLTVCKERGHIINLTINQGHLKTFYPLIKDLIDNQLVKGIGISIINNNYKWIKEIKKLSNNIVYHVINGINDVTIIQDLMDLEVDIQNCHSSRVDYNNCKILILGYKQFGFGVNYFANNDNLITKRMKDWYIFLSKYFNKQCTLSFDNLAIEQLNLKRFFTNEGWSKFYMGDDFVHTMYIDAVKQEFSPTSRTLDKRKSFSEISLIDYFNSFRNN